ncbi:MAG: GNAT family N-acetyltransferase [Acidimicrobiales bacterium]|nr:GNAT family N-acetyltransferase [Acidimicrobiales bacterium]
MTSTPLPPLSIERTTLPTIPWTELDAAPDRTICQTREWLNFLVETQGVEPVVARVLDGTEQVGWFTGAIARRGPVRILGSPFRGWTTAAMGFNLEPGVPRSAALAALPAFAFKDLGCLHLEFADRGLLDEGDVPDGFHLARLSGYELALVDDAGEPIDDDALLGGMKSYGRRDVRRSLRNGIEVEVVDPADPGSFAATYYAQVSEAFAKRDQRPTYPVERVEALIRHLGPTGRLLLLQSRTPDDGEVAATGIFPGLPGSTGEYWMGGSWRAKQPLLPNEALMWTALRTWRDRGAVRFNFGGGGKYKAKYGGSPHSMPWVRRSRVEAVERLRAIAIDQYQRRRRGSSG